MEPGNQLAATRPIETVLARLPSARPSGKGYRAPCPAHGGEGFNLSITEDAEGNVGLTCFSHNCEFADIVAALGLKQSDCFARPLTGGPYTASPLSNLRATYNTLHSSSKTLREQKANLELDLQQYALNPERYPEEAIKAIRERFITARAELDQVTREERELVDSNLELRKQLENELYGNNEIERASPQAASQTPDDSPQVLTLEQFLQLELKPREYVFAPILSTQGLAMLYSLRGIGKTNVALGIGYAVATGDSFLKWTAEKARRVLYVDGELPAIVLQSRLAKIVAHAEHEPPSADYFRIYTPDLQGLGAMPNIATPEGQRTIERYLDGVELVIFDNLSTLCRSGEENSAESWLPIQEWVLRLRRTGLAVLMLHHAGRSGLQRGTTKREDVLDTIISLRHPKDYSPEQGARFEVHFEKSRGEHGDAVKPFVAWLKPSDTDHVWEIQELEAALLNQVAELHKDGLKQRDISSELGISLGRVNRLIKQAQFEGIISPI